MASAGAPLELGRAPFRLLSQEEFERLTSEEKAAYLADAVHALEMGMPIAGMT